jgi:hypothetical protein
MRSIFIWILLTFSVNIYAKIFQISNISFGSAPVPDAIQQEILTLFSEVETEVNNELPNIEIRNYLEGMSNAQSMSGKGLGVDYASHMDRFSFGGGVGIAVDSGEKGFQDIIYGETDATDIQGFGIQPAFSFSFRTKELLEGKLKDFTFSTHFLYLAPSNLPQNIDLISSSYGFHIQYKLVNEKSTPIGFMKWGGIDFITGFEAAHLRIERSEFILERATKEIPQTGPIVLPPQVPANLSLGLTSTFSGTAKIGIKSDVYTLPLEVSSYIRMAWLFVWFGGLGADLTVGETKSFGTLDGTVIATDSLSLYDGISADATLNVEQSAGPDLTHLRWFSGIQFNQVYFKISLQFNRSILDNVWGMNVVTRFFF